MGNTSSFNPESTHFCPHLASQAALAWCIAVQECAMYIDWPSSALRNWPEERGPGGRLVFRGPR